jgi:hypothetical protein
VIDLRTAWLAGLAQGELRELAVLRAEHDARTVRAVRRLVGRGEPAPDVARARLGIAIAHDVQRQLELAGPVAFAIVGFVILFAAVLSVREFADGSIAVGVVLAAFVALSCRRLLSRPRARRLAADSERRNAGILAAAGERYVPAARGLVEPSTIERVVGSVLTLVYFTVLFGLMRQWIAGDGITVGGLLAEGAPFGVGITVFNQAVMARRNRGAAA